MPRTPQVGRAGEARLGRGQTSVLQVERRAGSGGGADEDVVDPSRIGVESADDGAGRCQRLPGIKRGHLVEGQVVSDAVAADGRHGGREGQLDGRGPGGQERARGPRIAQGAGRELLLQVQRHKGRAGSGCPGFLGGGLFLGKNHALLGGGDRPTLPRLAGKDPRVEPRESEKYRRGGAAIAHDPPLRMLEFKAGSESGITNSCVRLDFQPQLRVLRVAKGRKKITYGSWRLELRG